MKPVQMVCSSNQCTNFCMIGTSIVKELNERAYGWVVQQIKLKRVVLFYKSFLVVVVN